MNSRIDHIVIGTDNLDSGTKILETKLNTKFSLGGEHKVMGTHNKLLKLQSNIYLEVIANNSNVSKPSRQRWFSLDESSIKEKIEKSPRLLCWVLEVDNIEDTVEKCGYNPGEIIQLSRDELTWKVTVPPNGKLVESGILPVLIEWPSNQHPSKKLNNSKVSISKISLFHPEPYKIKNIISNLISSDLIYITEGFPKMELILTTQNEKVVID
tara:strand:- start:319 stop:954 length:636 start_codon:yes stop_codon:yes gene_type:complete